MSEQLPRHDEDPRRGFAEWIQAHLAEHGTLRYTVIGPRMREFLDGPTAEDRAALKAMRIAWE